MASPSSLFSLINIRLASSPTLIDELEDKLSIRNKELREVESRRADLERKLIEIESNLARKVSDLDTANDKNKDLR